MTTEDQTDVIDFLSRPSTHAGAAVERHETHASVVFLAGSLAYKLKRAVRFDYLDFSTAERRRRSCEAEVRLNRRTAPSLYRGVVAVTREPDGSLALGGRGPSQDWLVVMNRFPQDGLLDRRASANALDLALMATLADAIVHLHADAERRVDHGGTAGMTWVLDGNAAGLREFARVFDRRLLDRVIERSRAEFDRVAPILEDRRAGGFVRHGHGDLHLRNIVLIDGRPTLFDGIEFNDEIACTDVLYDLAFLLMDLWRRGLPRHANAVWNRYLAESEAVAGLSLMPLFLSCRAAVRAKTSATAASLQTDSTRRRALEETAREYLDLADRFLTPPPAALVAIGGLSGSGKTTLAVALAPALGAAPGAVVLRSDEIRKRMCGVPLLQRLGPEAYAPAVSARVYQALFERAASIVRQGHSAIADAVFARPSDRDAVEQAARAASVPFLGLWLDAPEPLLIHRTSARRQDASDADAAVVAMQRRQETGEIGWQRLDASMPIARVTETAGRIAAAAHLTAPPQVTPQAVESIR